MPHDRLRLLLVDDEQSLREPLAEHLEQSYGFAVDMAANHAQAMQFIGDKDGQYDVALIDRLLLPAPDGIQVMRDIKASFPEVECIIATGWGTEDRQIALQEGAFRYIEKPFDLGELALLIRSAAQQTRLRAINHDVLSKRDLDNVFQQITAAARSLVQADEAEIKLLDEDTNIVKSYGRPAALANENEPGAELLQQLAREIIRAGKTESFPNVRNNKNLFTLEQLGFLSLVCVPVPGEKGNLGLLCAYSRSLGRFDRWGDIAILQTLAGQAGLAIANARAFKQTQDHADYMEALVHASEKLTRTKDLQEQLQLAWDFARTHLKTPVFLATLYDEQKDQLQFPIFYDKGKRIELEPAVLEEAATTMIVGHVVKTAKEFYCSTSEERNRKCRDLQIGSTAVGDPCESCLFVPLIVGQDKIGAISVQSYDPHAFSAAFRDAFRALANHLAIAIVNARLVRDTQRRARDLKTLLSLSLDVASSLEPLKVLEHVCKAAVEFFQAEHSGLVLFEESFAYGQVVAEYPAGLQTVGMRIRLRGVPDEEQLMNHREPLAINNVAAQDTLGPLKNILLDKLNIQSTLIVPVVVKDKLLGSFSIDAVGHQRQFTAQELELAKSFAAQVAVAIDHSRLYSEAESRAKLLATLDETSRHIRAEKDPERLLHEIVRLAAELVGCQSGCLLNYERYRGELEITEVHQMPRELLHHRIPHDEGIIGLAASTGVHLSYPDYDDSPFKDPIFSRIGFTFGTAVPLRLAGEVAAVLFLADSRSDFKLDKVSLETLDRFANQAAIVLSTSQSLTAEQRAMAQQEILLKVSGYIQTADELDKVLHVVLTGVTAGYGLGLNRAAILLLNGNNDRLVGRLGIGHYDEATARLDWRADQEQSRDDLGRYIARLENGELEPTPIGEAVCTLALPTDGDDIFAGVMKKRRYRLVHKGDQENLPAAFSAAFKPDYPLIVAPLNARERAIGLLVADNKFTHAPITEELTRSLLTYVNAAAIAIENRQLFQESESRLAQVERTRKAASVVAEAVVRSDLRQTLNEIAESTRSIMNADAVTLYAYEETKKRFTEWGHSNPEQHDPDSMTPPQKLHPSIAAPYKLIRMRKTPYYRLTENGKFKDDKLVNRFVTAEGIQAAIGIQLRGAGRKMGVMFVNFRSPHTFTEDEISTIQLFADQAAAAIRIRQLYERAYQRANVLQGLYEAGRAISGSLTLQETLDQIATQALVLVGAENKDGCACHIALKSGSRLRFAAAYPPQIMVRLKKEMPTIPLQPGKKLGIAGRVAVSKLPDNLPNAPEDPDYIPFDPQTRSELAVPMKLGDQVLGVINVEDPGEHAFDEDDQHALELLAAQAAIAIHVTRLFDQVKIVAEIGREANSLELQPFVGGLFGRLTALFQERDISVYPNLGVYDAQKRQLNLIPTPYYPAEIQVNVQPIDDKSIMARVAKRKKPHYAPDVARDKYYRDLLAETACEVAVPVIYGGTLLGVLDLESPVPDAFSDEDQDLLQTIADQIASSLHNVQQYEELKKTRGLVGTREALAWTGMISSVYRHEMNSSAAIIRERLKLLHEDLGPTQTTEVAGHLQSMERVAQRIQNIPLAPPLSSEEGVQSFPLCALLRQRIEQLLKREYFRDIQLQFDCARAEELMVRASPEWIKIFVGLLVANAAEAMAKTDSKLLIVQAQKKQKKLEVTMQDNGRGIPASIHGQLFKRPVAKKKGERGSGVGLLMAQLIIQTYGGEINVESNSSEGTTMGFWLPIEE